MTYAEKLKDPRWQRKRLEIMERDGFECSACGRSDNTLHIHHWKYKANPWDAESDDLSTLCESCHAEVEMLKWNVGHALRTNHGRRALSKLCEIVNEADSMGLTLESEILESGTEITVRVVQQRK